MKKVTYLILYIIFTFFLYYSFFLFRDIFMNKIDFSEIKQYIDDNNYVLAKEKFIALKYNINEKTNHNFTFSKKSIDGLGVYKTKDNSVINLNSFKKYNINQYNYTISDFNQYLEELNIDFVYMESPDKNYFYKDYLNKYNLNYNYDSYKKLYKLFEKNGINYIDTHNVISKFSNTKEPYFYRGDYHWTSETAKNMAIYFGKYVNDNYGYNLDLSVLDDDNFNIVKYDNSFAGFYIRKLGFGKEYYDDFNYYIYNKDSDFKANYDGEEVNGSFEDVMYYKIYDTDDNIFSSQIMYEKQMYGIRALKQITNKGNDVQKRILVIGDSQFFPLGCFISLMFKNVDVIDIRTANGNFNGSVKKYIKNTKPDMVLYFTTTFDINDLNKIIN